MSLDDDYNLYEVLLLFSKFKRLKIKILDKKIYRPEIFKPFDIKDIDTEKIFEFEHLEIDQNRQSISDKLV